MKKSQKKAALAAIIIIALIAVSLFFIRLSTKKPPFEGSWSRVDSEPQRDYTYILSINDGKAQYVFTSRLLTKTIAEFECEALSKNEVRFFSDDIDKTLTYEMINDGTGIIFTPALTTNNRSEEWQIYIQNEEDE